MPCLLDVLVFAVMPSIPLMTCLLDVLVFAVMPLIRNVRYNLNQMILKLIWVL